MFFFRVSYVYYRYNLVIISLIIHKTDYIGCVVIRFVRPGEITGPVHSSPALSREMLILALLGLLRRMEGAPWDGTSYVAVEFIPGNTNLVIREGFISYIS